ncbi:MAG: HAD family hydrolase [Elusimicrobiaceae bacterium]|jgi:histidinol-phosphate phosphatase family protein|nr:HAD family hydrolase [Elusimicrobiaceae bacterium]MBT3955677.1 HAD family hydrolase [Elusimicrobiaceae bacterium]MBT4008269.1 HAD family hydrolase [Elusimicrobiaceae bacterium]MBT4402344.1 HAD family hydrolase [Elusimicrobiaceae bacterium]MBT4439799.1 HAD family hydrolase [Elusimicrobiaceae bacterium]
MKKIKAVFLDRDGTIIYEKPGTYIADIKDLKFYKNTITALTQLNKAGFKLFIVSNQSGIGRGYFTKKHVENFNKQMTNNLKPAKIEELAYCPHSPSQKCECRKPKTMLGKTIIKKYNIDVENSYMIGDKKSDIDFGLNLNLTPILVKTANGKHQIKKYGSKIKAVKVAGLKQAVLVIKRGMKK